MRVCWYDLSAGAPQYVITVGASNPKPKTVCERRREMKMHTQEKIEPHIKYRNKKNKRADLVARGVLA